MKLNSKILFAAWACHNNKWHTYQLWDGPLRSFFKQVITFDPKEYQDKFGKREMNAKFLEIVGKEKPDYIFFWFMLDEIDFETLAKIREISPKTVTLCYNGDDDYKFDNYTVHLFPFIDYFLSTQPDILDKYNKIGKKVFYSCGADIKEFKPSNVKKEIDVSFVGTPKNDRVNFMRYLLKNDISIRVYGAGWEKYPEFAKCHGGEINMHEFVDVINKSKINICLSKNYFGGTHILERFFEINACKSFCLTEYAKGYFPTFVEGKDIATFKDKEELIEKVKKYLKNDRARENIAKKAYLKTIKNFSNELLFSKALKFIESDKINKFGKLPEKVNKKIVYLGLEDLAKGKEYLEDILNGVEYIGFRNKGNYYLKYKEYAQISALEMTDKDMCVCDSVLNSKLIGDFLSVCLYYAYDLKNKSYFYSNLDISQIVTRKNYLIDNLNKFIGIFEGKSASFINKKNTNFVSWPLVRRTSKTKIPLESMEHIVFPYFERELLVLKNKNRIFRSTYPLKLVIYGLFNKQVAKIILNNTIKRTKNNSLIKIASFINKF